MTNTQIQKILKAKKITHCYIRKNGSYYRANHSGYTSLITSAGVYLKNEACKSAMLCRELDIIPIDVNEHNRLIVEEIIQLSSKLINH